MAGKRSDLIALLRRTATRASKSDPEFAAELRQLLGAYNGGSAVRNAAATPIPTDSDSRLHLVRHEFPVILDSEPVWPDPVAKALAAVVREREKQESLAEAGLAPSRSMLLTGPPGVGKTLAARWLAQRLGAPLYILDLAAVMSSYLGRTGNNLRAVLDFTRDQGCILLLDEFDAIAKRRDDMSEIGELKRLVTVLLQAIDDWPPTGLLLAATNHPDLLDPAVWRRFEHIVQFPMPVTDLVRRYLELHLDEVGSEWRDVLTVVLTGASFAELEQIAVGIRRGTIVNEETSEKQVEDVVARRISVLSRDERIEAALKMVDAGVSQRQVQDLTGVSRDTLRKRLKVPAGGGD